MRVLVCRNKECGRSSCRLCQLDAHVPLRCDEVERDEQVKLRTRIEDKMTDALLRQCWRCKAKFFKEDGCNHMTCSCGAEMCYVCRARLRKHEWRRHFTNEQAAVNRGQCPLYFDTKAVDRAAVQSAGRRAYESETRQQPAMTLHRLHGIQGLQLPQADGAADRRRRRRPASHGPAPRSAAASAGGSGAARQRPAEVIVVV